MKIWLADLTYTQQSIASDVMPAAVGYIGANIKKHINELEDLKTFKCPEDLISEFEVGRPDLIGFSNYCWNGTICLKFAKTIKDNFPKIITIMGGPSIPSDPEEQCHLIDNFPEIDFFIIREAENATVELIKNLQEIDFDLAQTTNLPDSLPNLIYKDSKGGRHLPDKFVRNPDLSELNSPYLEGILDKYFDGRFLPVIQTNRGCPFACAFCTEGKSYWNKVKRKNHDKLRMEVEYIAKKLAEIPIENRRTDLLIADSNFGMFKEDVEFCVYLGEMQDVYGYPKYINVATGKNKKERVLQAAKNVKGALKIYGSVQSLDPVVLDNIKRTNISKEAIMAMAMGAAEIGANTYAEAIIALPGDTKEKFFCTLKDLVNCGFNNIAMYQFILLPGTELNSKKTRKQFGLNGKFRIVPRCFGAYEFLAEEIISAEIEEIVVETNTLSFEDYQQCREMCLVVNVIYNEGVFSYLLKLLGFLGISQWELIEEIFNNGRKNERYDELVQLFKKETVEELWDDKQELIEYTNQKKIIERYISGEFGNNIIYKYKVLSLSVYLETLKKVLSNAIENIFVEHSISNEYLTFSKEVIEYHYLRIFDLFSGTMKNIEQEFYYNIPEFSELSAKEKLFDISQYRFNSPKIINFVQTKEQNDSINAYLKLFGSDINGLTRIISRIYLRQYFRDTVIVN